MPFQFEVKSGSIKSVSSKSIEMGESITITIDGSTDRYDYSTDDILFYSMTGSSYTIIPVVETSGKVKFMLMDNELGINVDEADIEVHRTNWTSVLDKNNLPSSYMYGNRLYTFERKKITAYDCNTGKTTKTYTIDNKNYEYTDATINGDIMKILWNDPYGYRYITTLNLKNSEYETNPFYSEEYDYRFEKNIGIDNGYEYKYESKLKNGIQNENTILRRKAGSNSSSWEEVGKFDDIEVKYHKYTSNDPESTNNILLVNNGWVYRSVYLNKQYLIAYRTRLSSLKGKQETETIGVLSPIDLKDKGWFEQQMTTDGTNLYFKAVNYNDQTILTKIALK